MGIKAKIFSDLERIAATLPSPLFWMDKDNIGLGCNNLVFTSIGISESKEQLIGKAPHEYFPRDIADIVTKNINQVIQEKKAITFEEPIKNISTGEVKYFLMARAPLFDDNGIDVIGTIVSGTDITDRKEKERLVLENEKHQTELREQKKFKKLVNQAAHDVQSPLAILLIIVQSCAGLTREKIFEAIEKIADFVPIPLYWLDENNRVLGANKLDLEAIGNPTADVWKATLGKTPYDLLPYEMADMMVKHNNLVMQTGKILSQEEQIRDFTTREFKSFNEFKAPLYDNNGKVIGILGTAVDITAEKNAKYLKLQNERQQIIIEEQNKFKKIADQLVHDIRSPLSSLSMMLKAYDKDIPEQIRIPIREAATNISDIANNLLSRYKKDDATIGIEEQQPVMIFLFLSQLLSDKKHQYKEMNIKFTNEFSQNCTFTFVNVQPSPLTRMLSNLVNNAVEALEGKKGTIHLELSIDQGKAKIVIQDNGKGMSKETIDKVLSNAPIATDKKDGHGIGLTQIRETLENNQGQLAIESKLGKGTKMIITFPIIESPKWIAKDIKINKGDTVVILDDDRSIHGAWDSRLKDYLSKIQLKHFLIGNKATDFINTSPKKDKILLLTDYELLKQDINGIDIIKNTKTKRAILVTSHHAEVKLRNTAVKNGIKILPKQLASDVPIEICEADKICINIKKPNKIDIVVVDDDEILCSSMVMLFQSYNKNVDRYLSPKRFLEKVSQYAKDTKIFLDSNFGSNNITGIELAKQLHDMKFTKLYLFSGKDFEKGEISNYLTVISKTDIDSLCKTIQ